MALLAESYLSFPGEGLEHLETEDGRGLIVLAESAVLVACMRYKQNFAA